MPIEKLEAALLADGGGHQQHIKLLRSLIEWLTVAMLVEQQSNGMIAPGPLLTLEDGSPVPDDGRSDRADMQQIIEDDEEELRMAAQPHDLERTTMSPSEARSDSVMTHLAMGVA